MFKKIPTGIEILQSQKEKPKKKLDMIVKGVCIYWITFVSLAWITYWVKDSVPDTLIQFGLGGSVLELVLTALIEITKAKLEKMN